MADGGIENKTSNTRVVCHFIFLLGTRVQLPPPPFSSAPALPARPKLSETDQANSVPTGNRNGTLHYRLFDWNCIKHRPFRARSGDWSRLANRIGGETIRKLRREDAKRHSVSILLWRIYASSYPVALGSGQRALSQQHAMRTRKRNSGKASHSRNRRKKALRALRQAERRKQVISATQSDSCHSCR